jgi:hypothetical protein
VVSTAAIGWSLAVAPAVPAGAAARAVNNGASPLTSPAGIPPFGITKEKPAPARPAAAKAAAGAQTDIDFSDLADGTVVTNQYPSASFSSTAGGVNYVSDQPAYNTPSFICTGPAGGSIDCTADTIVNFTSPVSDLTLDAVGVNDTGHVAEAEVFDASGLIATVPIIGDAGGYTAQLVDLSAYSDVTSIDLTDITDGGGIGWTNFSFNPAASFTVTGTDSSTTGEAGKQATGNRKDAASCASVAGQALYIPDEALGDATVATWQETGLTTATQFLVNFLVGTGDAINLSDTSQAAAEIKKTSVFTDENDHILTYIGQQLAGGATQITVPSGPSEVNALAFPITQPDLYAALRRTNGITVNGSGNLVGNHYEGTLTYVINESYGFNEKNILLGFGIAMRYLQTTCGAPFYPGGAHWFPVTVTVTKSFTIPASGDSR